MFNLISVIVRYPYGYGGPFERNYPADTAVTTVRDAAMEHFRLTPTPTTMYHLTAQDEVVADTATVGQVAGQATSLALRLVRSSDAP